MRSVVDQNGIIVRGDQAIATLMGYQSEEGLRGLHYSEQKGNAKYFSDEFLSQDQLVIQTETPLRFLSYYKYADQQYHLLLGKKALLLGENGAPMVEQTYIDLGPAIDYSLLDIFFSFFHDKNCDDKKSFWCDLSNHSPHENLFTNKELQCIRLLRLSFNNRMIADAMHISVRTVDHHIEHIKNKLNVQSRSDILVSCIARGYISAVLLF